MFNGHKTIEDMSAPTGFEQYLLIESDNGYNVEAYGFDDDVIMDIDAMLSAVFPDCTVEATQPCGGSNYAAIITDSRLPESVVVWTSADFYLSEVTQ